MTQIDTVGHLAKLLGTRAAAIHARKPGEARPAAGRATAGTLADTVALARSRIQALDRDDPQRRHKALRLVLETVLLQELGAGVASDPQFGALLASVQRDMEADPQIAEAAAALVDALSALAAGPGERLGRPR